MQPVHHPAAIWRGTPKHPHRWQAAVISDGADAAWKRTEHWLGDVHRTPELAIAQAEPVARGGLA